MKEEIINLNSKRLSYAIEYYCMF